MSPAFSRRARAFLIALTLDALLGDPPSSVHPVGWLGRAVQTAEATAPSGARGRRWYGALGAAGFPLLAAIGWRVLGPRGGSRGLPPLFADAIALDACFALRTLLGRADDVRLALERGDIEDARRLLRYHLVSREVHDLSASEVAGATIESVAENLSDGVIAPWLAYAVAGVPGVIAYRAVNTLDAMWGYRTERYADLGWASAHLDDIANYIPARLTALAIVAAAATSDEDARGAWRTWQHDGGATDSPNAGRPMAAMAGALGVVLTKREAYSLGTSGRAPVAADIARTSRLARTAAWLVAVQLFASMLLPMLRCTQGAR